MPTKQLSFVIDAETQALLTRLKLDLRAPTMAALFRKAFALTHLAVQSAKNEAGEFCDPLGTIIVSAKGETDGVTIALRG